MGLWAEDAEMAGELKCLSAAMEEYSPSQAEDDASSSGDLLKALYQELFPRRSATGWANTTRPTGSPGTSSINWVLAADLISDCWIRLAGRALSC